MMTTRSQRKCHNWQDTAIQSKGSPAGEEATDAPKTKKPKIQPSETKEPATPPSLHIYADGDTVKKFLESYKTDKDFTSLITRMAGEPQDMRKHRAYTAWNEAYIMLVSCIDYALDMTCIQSVSQCFIVCGIL